MSTARSGARPEMPYSVIRGALRERGLGQGSISVCLGSSWYPAVLHSGGWREPGEPTHPSERTVLLRFAYFLGSLVYWYSITDKKGDEI